LKADECFNGSHDIKGELDVCSWKQLWGTLKEDTAETHARSIEIAGTTHAKGQQDAASTLAKAQLEVASMRYE
jgi:hypothetical protein